MDFNDIINHPNIRPYVEREEDAEMYLGAESDILLRNTFGYRMKAMPFDEWAKRMNIQRGPYEADYNPQGATHAR